MTKRTKLLIGIPLALVIVLLLVVSLTRDTTQGVEIQAEKAAERKLVQKVSASGRIQPQTKVDIVSQINGQIIQLAAKEGDHVEEGDLLIVLDTIQLHSDVEQAAFSMTEINARLEGQKSFLEQAETEFKRQERLHENKLTSEQAFTDAKYQFTNAKASYLALQAQAKQANARYEQQVDNLRKTRIKAPMTGIITLVDCEVGEIAPAQTSFTQGKTLMTLSNLDTYEVEVEVDETEVGLVEMGQASDIEVDAFPDSVFKGEVVEIGNTAILANTGSTEQSTNFRVKVVFKQPTVKLRPGMSANVDITTNERENSLSVPYSAVVVREFDKDSLEKAKSDVTASSESSGVATAHAAEADTKDDLMSGDEKEKEDMKGVYVIREGKAKFIQVETGIADRQHIEITSGLKPSDTVITGPYAKLRTIKEGDFVKLAPKPEANKEANEGQ